jgi:hypothetical protein
MGIDTGEYDARKTVLSSKEEQENVFARHKERVSAMSIEEVTKKAVNEAFKEFDGLYMGWFTPDELDLVLEALVYYAHKNTKSNPDKAKQTLELLEAMNELKREGSV